MLWKMENVKYYVLNECLSLCSFSICLIPSTITPILPVYALFHFNILYCLVLYEHFHYPSLVSYVCTTINAPHNNSILIFRGRKENIYKSNSIFMVSQGMSFFPDWSVKHNFLLSVFSLWEWVSTYNVCKSQAYPHICMYAWIWFWVGDGDGDENRDAMVVGKICIQCMTFYFSYRQSYILYLCWAYACFLKERMNERTKDFNPLVIPTKWIIINLKKNYEKNSQMRIFLIVYTY